MAKQTINIGTVANDGTGDPIRTAFDKINQNFTEVYSKGRHILFKKGTPSAAHTGTTSETLNDSFTIPGGTLQAGDIIKFVVEINKTGTAGNVTNRLRVNTTQGVAGTVIGTFLTTAANLYSKQYREMWMNQAVNSQRITNSSAAAIDYIIQTSAVTELTINFAIDQVVNLTTVLASAGDSVIIRDWYIELIRA